MEIKPLDPNQLWLGPGVSAASAGHPCSWGISGPPTWGLQGICSCLWHVEGTQKQVVPTLRESLSDQGIPFQLLVL